MMIRHFVSLVAISSALTVSTAAEVAHSTNLWKPLSLVEAMVAGKIECTTGAVVIDLADVTAPKAGAKHEAKVVKVNEAGTFGTVAIQNQGGLINMVSADAEAKKLITHDQVEFQKCGESAASATPAAPAPTTTNSGR